MLRLPNTKHNESFPYSDFLVKAKLWRFFESISRFQNDLSGKGRTLTERIAPVQDHLQEINPGNGPLVDAAGLNSRDAPVQTAPLGYENQLLEDETLRKRENRVWGWRWARPLEREPKGCGVQIYLDGIEGNLSYSQWQIQQSRQLPLPRRQ